MQKSLAASALLAFAAPVLFAQAGAPPAAPQAQPQRDLGTERHGERPHQGGLCGPLHD